MTALDLLIRDYEHLAFPEDDVVMFAARRELIAAAREEQRQLVECLREACTQGMSRSWWHKAEPLLAKHKEQTT